ncbi:hypothetical protein K0B03_00480 [Patescibacteria group bacterium]|nr:hypothetical protein [Patescibacteria group bacterium]
MQYNLFTDVYYEIPSSIYNFYQAFLIEGSIFSAVFVFFIGLMFAVELEKLTKILFEKMSIDKSLEKAGIKKCFKRININFSISKLVGWLVKWFILIFTLKFVVDIMDIPQVSEFLAQILSYLPSLFLAIISLTIGVIISQLVYESTDGLAKASGIRMYHLVAFLFKWTIIIFTFLVVLEQIQIGMEIIKIFAGGLSLMLAIAGGLAFGLGGQYHAKELLDELKDKLK